MGHCHVPQCWIQRSGGCYFLSPLQLQYNYKSISSLSWHLNVKGPHLTAFLYQQVVELDFLYPSEGIHRRWDNGYRITSMAATWDQAALILSVPRCKPVDETQETLRTSAFPSAHVKV